MATTAPSKVERDTNLDLLRAAVIQWATQETQRLESETQFLRSVLTARGANQVGTANLATASQLVIGEIDSFFRSATGMAT